MSHRRRGAHKTPPAGSSQATSVSALASLPLDLTLNPAEFATRYLDFHPDPTQTRLLAADPHHAILCSPRQWGKSPVTPAKAVHHALTRPASLPLVLSPSARQSAGFLTKARRFFHQLHLSPKSDPHNDISL